MARGVNKVILVGNVGKDPETRYLPSGGAVTNLALATSESWKDKNTGQPQEKTEWHRVVFFNRLAEIVNEYVRKGSKLYIEGSLRTRSWEQDGVTRYATEIVVSEMQMLDSAPRDDGQGYQDDYQQQGNQQGTTQNRAAPSQQRQQRGTIENGAYGQPRGQQQAPQGGGQDFDQFDDDSDIPF